MALPMCVLAVYDTKGWHKCLGPMQPEACEGTML